MQQGVKMGATCNIQQFASVALGFSITFVFNLAVTWDIVDKKCTTDLPARPYTPIFTLNK